MSKTCDNKSVGVIIKKGNSFALIKRINYPVSYAFIAGHLDGETPENQAVQEALEEGAIAVTELKMRLHETFKNPCKRDAGKGHEWFVFEALKWTGELKGGSDAKIASWVSLRELRRLARRSESFLTKHSFSPIYFDLSLATPALDTDPTWQENPGLELVWLVMLRKLDIL